jgi:hypothetical protein
MQIRELQPEELDYVAMLCIDPRLSAKMREEMRLTMNNRKKWLKAMMRKGLQCLLLWKKVKIFSLRIVHIADS